VDIKQKFCIARILQYDVTHIARTSISLMTLIKLRSFTVSFRRQINVDYNASLHRLVSASSQKLWQNEPGVTSSQHFLTWMFTEANDAWRLVRQNSVTLLPFTSFEQQKPLTIPTRLLTTCPNRCRAAQGERTMKRHYPRYIHHNLQLILPHHFCLHGKLALVSPFLKRHKSDERSPTHWTL